MTFGVKSPQRLVVEASDGVLLMAGGNDFDLVAMDNVPALEKKLEAQ